MALNVCAPPKRNSEPTMTSQFAAFKRTIGSDAIRMGACSDATAPGSATEASSSEQEEVSICCRRRNHWK